MGKTYQPPAKGETRQSAESKALDRFAEMMIEKISSIQKDWKKPWFTEGMARWPKNLSGREYNGLNAFMLLLECERRDWKLPVFCTFDRAVGLNYTKDKDGKHHPIVDADGRELPHVGINKGEKSMPVFITTFTVVNTDTKEKISIEDYRKLEEEDKRQYQVFPKLQVYNVFNISQTNLEQSRPDLYAKIVADNKVKLPEKTGHDYSFPAMDEMIKNQEWICPIKTEHQDQAYYSISKDIVVVPEKTQFKDGESFYTNLFHEMAHSTGAESRLGRIKADGNCFGSPEYAREELVAEMTAALTANRYGMSKNIKEDSACYLKSWLECLKESPEFIKTTLFDVKRASAMLTQSIDRIQERLDNGLEYEPPAEKEEIVQSQPVNEEPQYRRSR